MGDVMSVVAVLLAGACASLAIATVLVLRVLVVRNRLAPRVRTGAPLGWLVSPRRHARLHRRLRVAVRCALDACPPLPRRSPPTVVHDLVDDLVRVAAHLDRQLVAAARQPRPHRAGATEHLGAEIARVEALAARVRRYASSGEAPPIAVADLADRLEALEAARDEVDALSWERIRSADPARPARPRPLHPSR